MTLWTKWTDADARGWIRVPVADDDKYARGVLGAITGSEQFPGAAVLGVEAAMRAGVGMVRYLGEERATQLVLQRRPEVVTVAGRVQAWLVGSGVDPEQLPEARRRSIVEAIESGLPTVVDAGALQFVRGRGRPNVIVTPHYRELATLLASVDVRVDAAAVRRDPARWAELATEALGTTVLLKGSVTHIAAPDGERITVEGAPAWLATAGTGDVLGGVLGTLCASHAQEPGAVPARIAATAALVHARAGALASRGGPIAALDVADAVPAAIRALLAA